MLKKALPLRVLCAYAKRIAKDFAFEDPHFDADDAVSGFGFGKTIIDIGAKRMKGYTTFAVPFRTAHFGATKATSAVDADAFRTEFERRLNALLHSTTEADAMLEIASYAFGDQLGIHLGFAQFLDVEKDFAVGHLAKIVLEHFDVFAFATDDDTGFRRKDADFDFVRSAFNLDAIDARATVFRLDKLLYAKVFFEPFRIIAFFTPF